MTTSSTKTRALCVATRCTSVDQFVATFHRFCGDDETFFVATMTSRPIGLETAFSIQLADKKPVLRGMCIVLDAWETPENRYRRPGIRLGIKRLTADSQVVFDRLKAASRPAHGSVAEATPPPGPAPKPAPTPLQQIAAGRTPGFSKRSATPPPLPPLLPPKAAPPVPTLPRDTAPQLAVVHVPPLGSSGPPTPIPRLPRMGGGSLTPPPLPVVEARSTPPTPVPSALPAEAKPAEAKPAEAKPVEAKPSAPNVPAIPSVRPAVPSVLNAPPAVPSASAAPSAPSASAAPAVPPVPKAPRAPVAPPVPAVPAAAASTPAKPSGSGAVIGAKPADAKSADAKSADARSADARSADARSADARSVDGSWGDAKPVEAKAPSAPLDARPVAPNGAPAATAGGPPPPAGPSPIAVTRFQFALRVDTKPPPIVDVEFKPTELVPRRRLDPRIVSDPSGADSPDDALPAVIIDRLSGPMPAEPRDTLPGFTAPEFPGAAVDPLAVLRTPGSSLILPANPLQDLSDESIEGFVDCTLYEETENIFHPGVDGPEWADPVAESTPPPAQPPRTTPERVTPQRITPQKVTPQRVTPQRITPPSTVPAMPLDAPPQLTVHAVGDTESLTVAPDDPALSRTASGELTRKPASVMAAAAEPIAPRTASGELGGATPVTVASDEIGARGAPDGSTLNAELNAELAAELGSRRSAGRGDPGLGPSESVVVEPDPDQSWAAAGELWSQTERRKPEGVPERLLSRPETPLPRPATNVPMDIGEGPDPASWFDSVSLPTAAGPGPQGLSVVIDGFAHEATPDPTAPGLGLPPPFAPGSLAEFGLAPGAPLPPGATGGFAPVGEPGAPFAPGLPPGFGPGAPYPPGATAGFAPPPGAPFAPLGMPFPGATGGFAPAVESSAAFPPGGTGGFAPVPSGAFPAGATGAFAPQVDPAMYARYSARDIVTERGIAMPPGSRSRPAWHRWVLIGGTAFAAIVIAFLIARVVRGANRAAPTPGISRAASAPAQPAAAAKPSPSPGAPRPPAAAQAALAADPPAADPPAAAAADRRAAAAPDGDPASAGADADPPDDDATESASGAPVVGSGPCRFTVATTPAGSAVRFDDQPMGASPLTIQGSCDKHKLDIAHIRYQSVTKWVTLAPDKAQQLEISLARPVHAVTVTSFPPGAELSIDGRRAGTTPATIQMMGFATVSLTLTKPGFQTVTKKVYSKVAQDRVFVKLMK